MGCKTEVHARLVDKLTALLGHADNVDRRWSECFVTIVLVGVADPVSELRGGDLVGDKAGDPALLAERLG